MRKKIAIVGAGFCGLAIAWYLSELKEVDIFDAVDIGEGTSGMAAGLLHPYAGLHCKLNWMGHEGYAATVKLLNESEKLLGRPVTNPNKGILRPALDLEQECFYKEAVKKYPEIVWLSADQVQEYAQGASHVPGILIKKGVTVYCSNYLEGLWLGCQRNGAHFYKKKIHSLEELDQYDLVIITAGALTRELPGLNNLPLNQLKGQIIELKWPSHLPPLKYSLNSHIYLLMSENNQSCIVGGTFERDFTSQEPDLAKARAELLPKLKTMFPPLEKGEIIACRSGIRSVAPNRLPYLTQIGPKQWVLAGMGSKGLLYHALMAENLVSRISLPYN